MNTTEGLLQTPLCLLTVFRVLALVLVDAGAVPALAAIAVAHGPSGSVIFSIASTEVLHSPGSIYVLVCRRNRTHLLLTNGHCLLGYRGCYLKKMVVIYFTKSTDQVYHLFHRQKLQCTAQTV